MRTERLDSVRARYRQEAMRRGVSPRDVDLLLGDITGKPLAYLIAHGEEPVDGGALESMLQRRWSGEPLQYIRGRTEFFSRQFLVDDRVLIPRPETEVLVEAAIARAPRGARLVDIGTGSGCIAISIERSRPDLRVTGADISLGALAVADRNRRRLESRVRLAAMSLLEATRGGFDVIVSNPPYIAESEVATLAAEVRDFEPRTALTPGPRGTEMIERIVSSAGGALLLLEIGFGQENAVRDLAVAHRFRNVELLNDLAGIPRVAVLSID
ncbi:MAG TPA: peptide chain release factor N(5)-glutamine methyltransferase [Thermoanaerobaculia bacterium]|nr:peptide chain release factor N(5)-glutamine methyltransferase [Thermoanaerobaculia bacterium]